MNAIPNHVEIPPIERELLGLLLVNPGAIHALNGKLTGRHFSHKVSRSAFEVMSALANGGAVLSPSLIAERIPADVAEMYRPVPFRAVVGAWMEAAPADGVTIDDLSLILSSRVMGDDLLALSTEMTRELGKSGLDVAELGVEFASRLEVILSGAKPERYGSIGEIARRYADAVAEVYKSERPRGFDWGIPEITKVMGYVAPGDLVVLGAPSGHGKTALATQVGLHIAGQAPVLMIQGEMDDQALVSRIVNAAAKVRSSDVERGHIREADASAVMMASTKFDAVPFDIDWRPAPTLERIRSRIRYAKHQRGGLGLVIVDHLKLVKIARRTKDRFEAIGLVCEGLKETAKDEGVAVLLLAQRTREAAKRDDLTFRISDLYGGGDIEENADSCLLLHMPSKKLKDMGPPHGQTAHDKWVMDLERWKGKAEAICGKRRRGKSGGKAELLWSGEATRFSSMDDEQDDLL